MYPSFITTHKHRLVNHCKACRPFLLLGSWASLAAFSLMIICLYPYPISSLELATVFLKLFFMSNAIVQAMYLFFVTAERVGKSFVARLLNRAKYRMAAGAILVPDLFPSLSLSSDILAEPVLYYHDDKLQPSLAGMD